MCGRTPPKAIVARMRVSSSSSPRIASCRWRGVIRLTLRSLAAFCFIPVSDEDPAEGIYRATHSCQLENFSGEVFEDSCDVYGGLSSNTHLVLGVVLQETLDTTAGELDK
jgi:hypothetical protein